MESTDLSAEIANRRLESLRARNSNSMTLAGLVLGLGGTAVSLVLTAAPQGAGRIVALFAFAVMVGGWVTSVVINRQVETDDMAIIRDAHLGGWDAAKLRKEILQATFAAIEYNEVTFKRTKMAINVSFLGFIILVGLAFVVL